MEVLEQFFQGGQLPSETFRDLSRILDHDEYVNLLGDALSRLRVLEASGDMIDMVLMHWDVVDGDMDSSFIVAAENFVCTNDDLRYVAKNATLSGPRYFMSQLMDRMSFGQIVNRILYAYETSMTENDLLEIKEYVNMYESRTHNKAHGVQFYLDRMLTSYAAPPAWVSIEEGENKSYLKTVSLGCDLEQKDVFVEALKRDATKLNAVDNMDFLIEQFSKSISDVIDTDASYTRSYRTWGPENRFIDRDCVENGPCRMLRCMCREAEEADGEKKTTWFTGACDTCDKRIRDLSHAVRYPHAIGGWKGCYCCFECMRNAPPYQMNNEDNERVIELQQHINNVGIMDRSVM